MTRGDDALDLQALLDGELELGRQLELESRLREDPALGDAWHRLERDREVLRGSADYHRAPAAFRARLAARVQVQDSTAGPGAALASRRATRGRARLVGAAAFALALLVATMLLFMPKQGERDERIAREAISSHVRATLGQRLVDVASSDQHTVKPWLSARLDFSPPVHEVAIAGVIFLGGRVDYVDAHPVAVLVYRQRQHVIDAFIWPESRADSALASSAERGFNAVHWTRAGMTHWVVSDLNREELLAFAQALDAGEALR